jgi:hypothetical protein
MLACGITPRIDAVACMNRRLINESEQSKQIADLRREYDYMYKRQLDKDNTISTVILTLAAVGFIGICTLNAVNLATGIFANLRK